MNYHALAILLVAAVIPPVHAADTLPLIVDEECSTALCLRSPEGFFLLRSSFRVQLDAASYNNDSGTQLGNGTNIRRARISTNTRLGQSINAKFTYDLSRDGLSGIRDAFISYTNPGEWLQGLRIRAGHFKEPFGMERLTSVRDLAFMERSLASALTPERNTGLELHHYDRHWTATTGIFIPGTSDEDSSIRYGTSARITLAPLSSTGNIAHIGASIAHRSLDSSRNVRFRQRPESRVSDQRLIDTGHFSANHYNFYGLESAWAKGPWSLQAEYIRANFNRSGSKPDISFNGWHIDAGWILTGEGQSYNKEKGTFGRLRPDRNDSSIWQLGLRLSRLDLNDADIEGGRQKNLTIGLTWYANHYLTVMTEYVQVLDISGGEFDNASPAALQARIQLVY